MSTLTSQRTFKALCRPPCRPLCRPLCHPPRRTLRPFSNHAGSLQAPISGYDTLTRRFSSYPKPLNLFALPSWQKAAGSGEYVDIHDLGNISDLKLNNYDVLVTDINEKTLRTEISKVFGIDYLGKATEDDVKRGVDAINGYLYGDGRRPMVPCVVSKGNKARWVHFLVNTGAPVTFLSEKVCDTLDLRTDVITSATIAGCYHQIRMSPEKSHFADINILGSDFCDLFKFMPLYLGNGKVKYVFIDRWAGAKEVFML